MVVEIPAHQDAAKARVRPFVVLRYVVVLARHHAAVQLAWGHVKIRVLVVVVVAGVGASPVQTELQRLLLKSGRV